MVSERTVMPEQLQDVRRAVDQLVSLPEDPITVKEPSIVLVEQASVVLSNA